MKNWKTTLAGVFAALAALFSGLSAELDADAATRADWPAIAAMLLAGAGLVLARDARPEPPAGKGETR